MLGLRVPELLCEGLLDGLEDPVLDPEAQVV